MKLATILLVFLFYKMLFSENALSNWLKNFDIVPGLPQNAENNEGWFIQEVHGELLSGTEVISMHLHSTVTLNC